MKKKFTLVLSVLMMAGLAWDYNHNMAHTNGGGAPANRTGSPGDGQSCMTGCHGMSPGTASGSETVTVGGLPLGGYIPGTTYNLSLTAADPSVSKFGFELSPQNATGTVLGTLISGTGSQIVGSGWLTHAPASTSTGSQTWDFQWTAPTAGTGEVTFYYSVIFANGVQGNNGDVMLADNVVLSESTGAGINDLSSENLSIYPNPVIDVVHVNTKDVDEEIMIRMYGVDGREVLNGVYAAGENTINLASLNIKAGIYFMHVDTENGQAVRKLLIK